MQAVLEYCLFCKREMWNSSLVLALVVILSQSITLETHLSRAQKSQQVLINVGPPLSPYVLKLLL